MDGHPEYIVFNGKTKALNDKMKVNVGEKSACMSATAELI